MGSETMPAATPLSIIQWQEKLPNSKELLKQVVGMEKRLFAKQVSWADEIVEACKKRSSRLWCCLVGDVVVGYLLGSLSTLTFNIQRLAVQPAMRRQGIATCLIQAATLGVLKQGASVCLSLHVENPDALALYRKLGFSCDAVLPDYHGPGRPSQRMMLQADRQIVQGWLPKQGAQGRLSL